MICSLSNSPSRGEGQKDLCGSDAPNVSRARITIGQRAPNPPEFAQPRLSRVNARSSPAKG